MRFLFFFAWFDLWVGAYVERRSRSLFVCPPPCMVLVISNEIADRRSHQRDEGAS